MFTAEWHHDHFSEKWYRCKEKTRSSLLKNQTLNYSSKGGKIWPALHTSYITIPLPVLLFPRYHSLKEQGCQHFRLFPLSVNCPFDQLRIRCLGRALWEFEPSRIQRDVTQCHSYIRCIRFRKLCHGSGSSGRIAIRSVIYDCSEWVGSSWVGYVRVWLWWSGSGQWSPVNMVEPNLIFFYLKMRE